jgi:rubredoxin
VNIVSTIVINLSSLSPFPCFCCVTQKATDSASSATAKSNPFGAAKPRELVLQQKGVDPKAVDAKIDAKVTKPRLTKVQQEAVDALQAEIDAKSTDELTNKMKELLASFKEEAEEKKKTAATEPPKKFERPSERRARLEQEGRERGGGGGGGAGYERQGNFSSFSGGGGRGGESRPGDWPCPSCSANNFASRNSCFKCHAPREEGSGGGGGGGGDAFSSFSNNRRGGGRSYENNGGDFSSFGGGRSGGGGRGGESRPGDWPCPSCSANNFSSRNSCFKCHAPREEGSGGGGGGYSGGDRYNSGGGGGRGGESRPGDWPCPSCSANNFASRDSCFKCHAPRA